MKISARLVAPLVASALMIAFPAFAQHRSGGGRQGSAQSGGGGNRGSAVPRGESRQSGGRDGGGSRPAPVYRGSVNGRVAPRVAGRPYYYANRVAPVRFYSPYYSFRPRLNLGFGLWLGYPIVYGASYYSPYYYDPYYYDPYYDPYYGAPYYDPYYRGPVYGAPPYPSYPPNAYPPYPPSGFPNPPSNGFPNSPSSGFPNAPSSGYPGGSQYPNYPPSNNTGRGDIDVQANMGGLSFEITPGDAQVFIDGDYMGTVEEFTPRSQPLGVKAGRHHIEIRLDGYQTMAFDADVVAGQVLPYQGQMER